MKQDTPFLSIKAIIDGVCLCLCNLCREESISKWFLSIDTGMLGSHHTATPEHQPGRFKSWKLAAAQFFKTALESAHGASAGAHIAGFHYPKCSLRLLSPGL